MSGPTGKTYRLETASDVALLLTILDGDQTKRFVADMVRAGECMASLIGLAVPEGVVRWTDDDDPSKDLIEIRDDGGEDS